MKKIGNQLVAVIGGREIHPVSVCVGGFYQVPTVAQLQALIRDLRWGLAAAEETARWAANLVYPQLEIAYEFVSLSHPDEYPLNEGRIVTSSGLDIPMESYESHFVENQVPHSNALHSQYLGSTGSYLVGPLARVNLNFEKLSPLALNVAANIGFAPPVRNPFRSLIARSLELVHAFEEALAIVADYRRPLTGRNYPEAGILAGQGAHCTEAPRGLLYHRYQTDQEGLVSQAKIVAPTSQNLRRMEDDLWHYIPSLLSLPLEVATFRCEQLIRSYDPCISCATHFLRLEIENS